jgi:hypothetical protein
MKFNLFLAAFNAFLVCVNMILAKEHWVQCLVSAGCTVACYQSLQRAVRNTPN